MTIDFTGKTSDFLKIGVRAAGRGDVETVREILKSRPKWLHQLGSHGRTMLWEACHKGKLDMVKYLVKRKANLNACGSHYTPYFVELSCYCIARFKRHHAVADYLQERGAEIDIHTAAFLSDLPLLQRMLKAKRSLLHAGHPQHEMLPPHDPRGNFAPQPAAWATPLCYALRGASVETVDYLLRRGSKVQGFERELFIAADGCPDKVELLLEHGAAPEHHGSVLPDEGKLFELLTAYGKPVQEEIDSGELVYLCRGDRGGNPTEVRRLLELGADVNFQDHKGKTALHRASRAGFLPAMEILLKAGACCEAQDLNAETPIFDAVRSTIKDFDKQQEAVCTLLKAGCSLTHKNRHNHTAIGVAKSLKSPKRSTLLRLLTQFQ